MPEPHYPSGLTAAAGDRHTATPRARRRRWSRPTPACWWLAFLVIGSAAAIWALKVHGNQLIDATAVQSIATQVKVIEAVRQVYSDAVVPVAERHGITVSHEYAGSPDAIPLPVTLAIEIGARLSDARGGAHLRLFSDYPFPWRKDRVLDEFERAALAALRRDPSRPFYRFEWLDGRYSLRYAVAERLGKSCVNCHNTHPDSPKRDWKVNDVLGAIECISPLDDVGPRNPMEAKSSFHWALVCVSLIGVLGVAGLGISIRRQQRSAKAALASEARRRAIMDNAATGIVVIDENGTIESFNAAAERIFGYAAAEVIGQNVQRLMPSHTRERHDAYLQRYLAGGPARTLNRNTEQTALRKDGVEVPVELHVGEAQVGDKRFFIGMITDITVRRRDQQALAERSRLAQFTAEVALAVTQPTSLPQALQACAELVVKRLDAAFARIWTLNSTENVLELRASAGMYTHLDGAHARVPVGALKIGRIAQERRPHVTNSVATDPRISDPAWAQREGMAAFAGYPLLVDDTVVGVLAMFARQPISDAAVQALAAAAHVVALYLRRQRAEELARERNHLRDAVRSQDELLGVVGHELRTPLAAVRAMSELLLTDGIRQSDECGKFLQSLHDEVIRMSGLVNDLLEVARLNSGAARWNWSTVSLTDCAAAALDSIRPLLNAARVELAADVVPQDLTMNDDASAVRRLMLNLVSNAHKHTADGVIRLRAVREERDGASWIKITVADTGSGMSPNVAARLGQPFALNSGAIGERYVKGAGLGLAICRGIVAAHGGRITVHSTPGKGTAVTVLLRADLEAAVHDEVNVEVIPSTQPSTPP